MKHFYLALFFALSPTLACIAQDEDAFAKRPPKLIVQTGIGLQWFGETYKLYTLSAERPFGNYWHMGLQGSYYFKSIPEYYYYSSEFLGGFELGGFAKHFLHGRFSGRKSGLYIGPEIRFGSRRFRFSTDGGFPPPPVPTYQPYKEQVTKILLRWGAQWQFGHATLEIAAPFGVEFSNSSLDSQGNTNDILFMLLPTMQLGVAF